MEEYQHQQAVIDAPSNPSPGDGFDLKRMLLLALNPFHDKEQDDKQKQVMSVFRPSMDNPIGEKAGIIVPGISQRLSPEQWTAQQYQSKGTSHLSGLLQRGQHGVFGHNGVLIHANFQQIGHREQAEIKAPEDIRPVGAMPKAAEAKYDNHVADDLPFLVKASQREAQIVKEPRVERDVPATPVFRNVTREHRDIEIPHQPDSDRIDAGLRRNA